MTFTYKDS
ncbi:uncharacterized protein FFB14_15854 [Fusarium fujikuroi]|nr:uncharacterized protein FFB14_15854 [Fusarium fujikuroi]